jgi:hypothetical protein
LLISLYGITRGVKSRREADVPRAL